jgi:site-specific recombinase XerD
VAIEDAGEGDMARYLAHVGKEGLAARSQARVLSALRGFFKYLLREREVRRDPTQQMEGPRLAKRLPVVMTDDEVLRLAWPRPAATSPTPCVTGPCCTPCTRRACACPSSCASSWATCTSRGAS